MDTNHCIASAISAGLGAITFRNHLRSLTESSFQNNETVDEKEEITKIED